MENLLGFFVHQPLRLLVVAGAFVALRGLVRRRHGEAGDRARVLWIPATCFAAFAAWEWLVMSRTPEANIRVDLLVIWPVVLVVAAWSLVRALRG